MSSPSAIAATPARNITAARRLPELFALLLGVAIFATVGMAGADVIHNAAHDARHATVFPCH